MNKKRDYIYTYIPICLYVMVNWRVDGWWNLELWNCESGVCRDCRNGRVSEYEGVRVKMGGE
ncbi:hypothetical protein BofuT4_uP007250.1 [Botrytis cinerea T4]|uniref:Uncharacterized protein n=1 Tax=Botryotinia fuckeliana (strain T4) TaxID=999810 RepID=G2XXG9_BOTF4|nr:hypothetical protein BofuT4_uP007250.1 [Botrytis cinerea T4]